MGCYSSIYCKNYHTTLVAVPWACREYQTTRLEKFALSHWLCKLRFIFKKKFREKAGNRMRLFLDGFFSFKIATSLFFPSTFSTLPQSQKWGIVDLFHTKNWIFLVNWKRLTLKWVQASRSKLLFLLFLTIHSSANCFTNKTETFLNRVRSW